MTLSRFERENATKTQDDCLLYIISHSNIDRSGTWESKTPTKFKDDYGIRPFEAGVTAAGIGGGNFVPKVLPWYNAWSCAARARHDSIRGTAVRARKTVDQTARGIFWSLHIESSDEG